MSTTKIAPSECTFPADFVWGAATAAYQIEGAANEDPRIRVRPLPDVFPARPYGVALRRGRTPGAAAQAFIAALRDSAGSIASRWVAAP